MATKVQLSHGGTRKSRYAGPDVSARRERWMAFLFAAGSICFLVGPFPGYIDLVGPKADSITFFVGSILFTAAGALQRNTISSVGLCAWTLVLPPTR